MSVLVRIPSLGESVSEGVIARWLKKNGDQVAMDEVLLELETDKAAMEITATAAGALSILKNEGEKAAVGEVVASIDASKVGAAAPEAAPPPAPAPKAPQPQAAPPTAPAPRAPPAPAPQAAAAPLASKPTPAPMIEAAPPASPPSPSLRKWARATGKSPLRASAGQAEAPSAAADVERVPMTTLRKRIAERLVEAQHTAAILSTFNEIDMKEVMAIRKRYKEKVKEAHGVDLGFMSFFGRAVIQSLAEIPQLNAKIEGTDIVYQRRVHLGVAVSTERGLVVPVVRDADQMSLVELEAGIAAMAKLARDQKLKPDHLAGGTFSISNGGVFGSLLSTPILNPPQSGILGMHKIQERPVVVDGQIVVRPMMYVALSYDHRLIDGREAVSFLVKVKERLEDPARLLLEV
ncbi:MAG: 2-oxoglutarate dehydrogenase complex dihydrolipoyllysine-residue succinyltransferase [Myxococcota bacterium]